MVILLLSKPETDQSFIDHVCGIRSAKSKLVSVFVGVIEKETVSVPRGSTLLGMLLLTVTSAANAGYANEIKKTKVRNVAKTNFFISIFIPINLFLKPFF
jgi:hypothetical protein